MSNTDFPHRLRITNLRFIRFEFEKRKHKELAAQLHTCGAKHPFFRAILVEKIGILRRRYF
jgi:hypothetical protein